jgi:NADH:ubiquinone oxidoreductase subunit 2 (subunit N)
MYFDPPGDLPEGRASGVAVRSILALNAAAVLVLGLAPNALIQLCTSVIR